MKKQNNTWLKNSFLKISVIFFLFFLTLMLSACSTTTAKRHRYSLRHDAPPCFKVNCDKIPDAVPKAEPFSKRGNPKSYVVLGRRYYVLKSSQGYCARGTASWYGMKFHRFHTSNGETYDVSGMTAAHKTLPLPTYLQVHNLRNGKKVIVKVNDRGPFSHNRLIDLSYAAAKKLGMAGTGTAPVEIRAITPGTTCLIARNTTSQSTSSTQNWPYIHLGIFKQRSQAQKLALQIKNWTHSSVRIAKTPINQRLYYQVVVGPLSNVKSSKQLRHQLQLAGLSQGFK